MGFGIFNTVGSDIRRPKSLISANSHTQRTASFPGIERAVPLHGQSLATSGAPWYGDRCYLWSHFLKNKPHFHFSISIVPVLFHFLLNLFFYFYGAYTQTTCVRIFRVVPSWRSCTLHVFFACLLESWYLGRFLRPHKLCIRSYFDLTFILIHELNGTRIIVVWGEI